MAAQVWELVGQTLSIGGDEAPAAADKFIVTGAPNFQEAFDAILLAAGGSLAGLPFNAVDLQDEGGGVWSVGGSYRVGSGATGYGFGTPTNLPPGTPVPPGGPLAPTAGTALGPEWSFDTTGGTQHVTQSRLTRYSGRREDTFSPIPDYKGAIGVTKESVDGVDVVTRKMEFSLSLRPTYVTLGYVQQLYRLTGTVNDNPFLGFNAGEVLFLGVSGQSQTPTDGVTPAWTLTYKFAASPTRGDPFEEDPDDVLVVAGNPDTEVVDPGRITVPGAYGWDYVWVSYSQKVDGGRTILVPQNAYVETVYNTADFSLMGLFADE